MKKYLILLLLIFIIGCNNTNETYELMINKIGNGQGIIISLPNGINCGNTCTYKFSKDSIITLNAKPNNNSEFEKWLKPCKNNSNCKIKMTDNLAITALFRSNALDFNLPKFLPTGNINNHYSYRLQEPKGGIGPYKYELKEETLKNNISLKSGILIGTPIILGTKKFEICVVDNTKLMKCKNTTLRIEPELEDDTIKDNQIEKKEENTTNYDITGIWDGTFKLSNDVSFFCSNLNELKHSGTIHLKLIEKDKNITGSANVIGIKSINFNGNGNCTIKDNKKNIGKIFGKRAEDKLSFLIDFEDEYSDQFIEIMRIEAKIEEDKIIGELKSDKNIGEIKLNKLK